MSKRCSGSPSIAGAVFGALACVAFLVALPGCTFVYDDSGGDDASGDKIEQLSDATTNAIMGAFGDWKEESSLDGLASPSELSKNGAIMVTSANGEKLHEGTQAKELAARLSFERWIPISTEALEAETEGADPSVSMILSQDETVLLGESEPSDRIDVGRISFWPDKCMARYDVTVEDGEGFFLFDGIGVTTKEGTSLLTVCFQIPDDVAEYAAGL